MTRWVWRTAAAAVVALAGVAPGQTPPAAAPGTTPARAASDGLRDGDVFAIRSAGQPDRRVRVIRVTRYADGETLADLQDLSTGAKYTVPGKALTSLTKAAPDPTPAPPTPPPAPADRTPGRGANGWPVSAGGSPGFPTSVPTSVPTPTPPPNSRTPYTRPGGEAAADPTPRPVPVTAPTPVTVTPAQPDLQPMPSALPQPMPAPQRMPASVPVMPPTPTPVVPSVVAAPVPSPAAMAAAMRQPPPDRLPDVPDELPPSRLPDPLPTPAAKPMPAPAPVPPVSVAPAVPAVRPPAGELPAWPDRPSATDRVPPRQFAEPAPYPAGREPVAPPPTPTPTHLVRPTPAPPVGDVVTQELQPFLDQLANALRPSTREWAATAIAESRHGWKPEVKEVLFHAARTDPAPTVRAHCVRTLVAMGYHEQAFVRYLEESVSAGPPAVRQCAALALEKITGGP